MNVNNIISFLTVGYFLDYDKNESVPIFRTNPSKYKNYTESELIKHGSSIFQEVIQDLFKMNCKHVIPLSGGLDSRAILAALYKMTPSDNIETYTFGMPGSFDYEFGKNIAKKFKIKNYAIDFNEVEFNSEMINDASQRFSFQTHLFYHPDYREIEQKFSDYQYWSGFLGGEAAGGHYYKFARVNNNLNDNKKFFIQKNKFSPYSFNENYVNQIIDLIDYPEFSMDLSNLSIYEIIDFYNRQTKYIAPHVLPCGFNHVTPFATKKWLEFICSIPSKYRINNYLYEKILLNLYPEFFKYPTKNKLGLGLDASEMKVLKKRVFRKLSSKVNLNAKKKDLNYFDFNAFVRERNDINLLVKESLHRLDESKIIEWIDIPNIYKAHMNKESNNGGIILLLASLEFNLRNKSIKF